MKSSGLERTEPWCNSYAIFLNILTIDKHMTVHWSTCPGWHTQPIHLYWNSPNHTTGTFLGTQSKAFTWSTRARLSGLFAAMNSCRQWRWHQRYLYQAQNHTGSSWWSPSCRWKSLAPIPATPWFDLWAWAHDRFHSHWLHPCFYRGSGWSSPPSLLVSHCCWKPPKVLLLCCSWGACVPGDLRGYASWSFDSW